MSNNQKQDKIKAELTGADVLAAYDVWVAAKAALDAAEDAKRQAEAILTPFMDAQAADVATIAGRPVFSVVAFDKVTLDPAIVRKFAPRTALKAERSTPVRYLRKSN